MEEQRERRVAVLGSTGSVGEQALDVAERMSMRVTAISANRNVKRTEEQARKFGVGAVAMADEQAARELRTRLRDTDIQVYAGSDGICEMIGREKRDVVLNSIIGEAGLLPSLAIIDSGARLALANKESLVVAGEIVTARAREKGVEILPVDSEHSAIFQSLRAGKQNEVKRIWLTASGGPFFGKSTEEIYPMRAAQALAHPTWSMGAKITVDSASMMNKGFEVIEAVHLFGVSADRIRVMVHRESIIHSMVEYIDNSVIAQLSKPDMRLCAQYAMTYPDRTPSVIDELDLCAIGKLSFFEPDTKAFPLLPCAIDCIGKGGALPAVLNAANEIAVASFLRDEIPFGGISEVVLETVAQLGAAADVHTLDEILQYDRAARELTQKKLAH